MITGVKIGKRIINSKSPCFIIAEAGVNHNGRVALAKKLVDVAKAAGADAVKFQTFLAKNLAIKDSSMADYQKKNIGIQESQFSMLRKLELRDEDFISIKKYCDRKKIIFLSTPHSEDAVDFLFPLVPAYKVGSGDITNLPLLRKIAGKKKPIILSTGMSTLTEIKEAVKAIKKQGNNKIILLHCTTNYPCPLEEVNLRAMPAIEKKIDCLVGYSDHTLGDLVPVMAIAMGARVIEKHFTLDKNLPGPDHKASLEPKELKNMVERIRDAEKALGQNDKKPTKSEEKTKKVARKSIVANVDIPKGTKIAKNMLIMKRPGTGIAPGLARRVIGKRAKIDIAKDTLILFEDLR